MNIGCVCAHTMQCKLHHVPIRSMYVIKFNIAYLCNCSASVKSIGMMTCINLMMLEGALQWSLLDTELLQTMKSGILQSGMYDALQNMYSIQYVCVQALTAVDIYMVRMAIAVLRVYSSIYEINMIFVIDQPIHTRYL